MQIGSFTYDSKADTYFGEIRTLSLHRLGIMIQPARSAAERGPDYRVVMDNGEGVVELGAAWKKSSERGQSYLSIVLDDPASPTRWDVALFSDEGENTARLVWTRPKPQPKREPKQPEPERPAPRKAKRRSPESDGPST